MDLQDIFNENHSLDIPQWVFDTEIKRLVREIAAKPGFDPNTKFDAKKHINYKGVEKKFKFEDLGIKKTHVQPINEIAATSPFDLFTEEAADMMKYELFSKEELVKKYGRLTQTVNSTNTSSLDFLLSGFIDDTPFTKAAWESKELKDIVNDIMQDKLVIPHQFAMSHINVSLADSTKPEFDPDVDYVKLKAEQDAHAEKIGSLVSWHYDSPPLVCVTMLSAKPGMVGGETGIKLGDESVMRLQNTKPGCATMLQGRCIKHIAMKPLNNADRISYVVNFIPEDPNRVDTTCATSERPGVSAAFTNDKFYPTFLNYRFERVEQRLKSYRTKLMENYNKGAKFDQLAAVDFMKDIEDYLHICYKDFEVLGKCKYPPDVFSVPYSELK